MANPTVGEFLEAVRAEADLSPATFEIYAKKFRRLVAGIFGIRAGAQKHDYRRGGHQKWLARVHAVRFSRLTPTAVQRWKKRYMSAVPANTIKEARAKRTVASILRSTRALFAPKIIGKIRSIKLPTILPLDGVDIPRVAPAQYVSKINPELLFHQAQRELESPTDDSLGADLSKAPLASGARRKKESDTARANRVVRTIASERACRHQMFRALCLALFAGLRRDEIDTLTWKQIDFENSLIRVETNEYTRTKSDGSATGVDIDPGFSALLRSWMKKSTSPFVIAGDVKPRPDKSTYHHYRAATAFRRLMAWLRAQGVDELRALHTMRKEFGTQINRTHGLFAASAALRHSSIQLTRAVYIAKKDRAVFALPTQAATDSKRTAAS
jgi:integrase